MLEWLPMEALKRALEADPGIAYALVFGSAARGTAHAHSDVDVAIGLSEGQRLTALDLGDLVSRMRETAPTLLTGIKFDFEVFVTNPDLNVPPAFRRNIFPSGPYPSFDLVCMRTLTFAHFLSREHILREREREKK